MNLINLTAYGVLLGVFVVKSVIGEFDTAALAGFLIVAMIRIGQLEEVVLLLSVRQRADAQARQQGGE